MRERGPSLVRRLWWADPTPIEVQMALLLTLVGAWLLAPPPTFASTSAFAVLARPGELVVGVILLVLGGAGLVAVARGAPIRWRRAGMFAAAGVCASWSMSFWLGNPAGTGWLTWAVLALGPMWAVIRLGAEQTPHE